VVSNWAVGKNRFYRLLQISVYLFGVVIRSHKKSPGTMQAGRLTMGPETATLFLLGMAISSFFVPQARELAGRLFFWEESCLSLTRLVNPGVGALRYQTLLL
jgi:hypothetical protein